MQDHDFTFSVVMPVYNVEKYLAESIESLLNQTIGFKDHIQLILVNDGSPDHSEAICLRFRDRYPDNITYVRQENAGVSAARNTGLRHVRGEYVNFLDSDDKWDSNAFERALEFMRANPRVSVAAGRLLFFEAHSQVHKLDYRFDGDRVIDTSAEYDHPHLHVGSAFVRRAALEGMTFDTQLKYAEDFKFIAPLILRDGAYGLLSSATYWYRRRQDNDSALNTARRTRSWYLDTPRRAHLDLFAHCERTFGSVPQWAQFAVMYDLQWRLRMAATDVITAEEEAEYKETIVRLLCQIDDGIILAQRNLFTEQKLFALSLKHGKTISEITRGLRIEKGRIYYDQYELRSLKARQWLAVDVVEVRGDELLLEGHVNTVVNIEDVRIEFKAGSNLIEATLFERVDRTTFSLGEAIHASIGFTASIPLSGRMKITPALRVRGFRVPLEPTYGRHVRLTEHMQTSYFTDGPYTFRAKEGLVLVTKDDSALNLARREVRFLRELVSQDGRSRIAKVRIRHQLGRLLPRSRAVWLISDRIAQAGDNGEAFFSYLCRNPPKGVTTIFVIAAGSPDLARLQAVGRVVTYGSPRHRRLFLRCSKIISSIAEGAETNLFGEDVAYVKDLFSSDFVFLPQGFIKDDLSRWLGRYKKPARLFITSAAREYDSIINGDYYYTKREVRLTGLPRHDLLRDGDWTLDKTVVVMPTWRKSLTLAPDAETGARPRFPGFEDSGFFRFWNAFINDPRLLAALSEYDYRLEFILHPELVQEAASFVGGEAVTVRETCDYSHELGSARLLVTDYSSVAMDFAYLYKPVVYAQFDRDRLTRGHSYEPGYFDYESDGFGPVCTDLASAVAATIDALTRGCRTDEEYRRRSEAFFFREAGSNCGRVLREIIAVDEEPGM